jgi:D-threo-aldose 1-dehydrogenase
MDPTARRKLGRSDLSITQFGFGTAPFSGWRDTIPEDVALATIQAAWDGGVRMFDTSPYYGYGRAELRLGTVLRDKPREDYVLSTKIGRVMRPIGRGATPPADWRPGGLRFAPTYDYSYDGVHRSLEQSMLRMGIDSIDIVFIHDVDFWTTQDRDVLDQRFKQAMEGAHKALVELRAAGVIKAFGVGLNEADTSARFVRAGDFDCVLLAGRYTLLEQGALADFLPLCEQKGVGVIIGGPLNSGILATGVREGARYDYKAPPAHVAEKVTRLAAVCARHNVELPAAALQFPLGHAAVAGVIPGAMNAGEVSGNLALFRKPLPAQLWADLRAEGLLDAAAPVPQPNA